MVTVFAPDVFCCLTWQLWLAFGSAELSWQVAELSPVVENWSITQSGGVDVFPVHTIVLLLAAVAAIWSTRLAVVHVQPRPGQFGPA
jgi:hypothetical protein